MRPYDIEIFTANMMIFCALPNKKTSSPAIQSASTTTWTTPRQITQRGSPL
jgi:hypothetical protein